MTASSASRASSLLAMLLLSIAVSSSMACFELNSPPITFTRCEGNECELTALVNTPTFASPSSCVVGYGIAPDAPDMMQWAPARLAAVNSATGEVLRFVTTDDEFQGVFNAGSEATQWMADALVAKGNSATNIAGFESTVMQSHIDSLNLASGESAAIVFYVYLSPRPDEQLITQFSFVVGTGTHNSDANILVSDSIGSWLPSQLIPDHPDKCKPHFGIWGIEAKCRGPCPKAHEDCKKKFIRGPPYMEGESPFPTRQPNGVPMVGEDTWEEVEPQEDTIADHKISKRDCLEKGGVCQWPYWDKDYKKIFCKKCFVCRCKRHGGKGDPHFVGWNEQKFDFMGMPDRTFNLLTDHGILVNSKFVNADLRPEKAKTYMGSIGVLLNHQDRIMVACNRDSAKEDRLMFSVNGQRFSTGSVGMPRMILREGTHVGITRDGQLEVETPMYLFLFRFSSSPHASCMVNFVSKYKLASAEDDILAAVNDDDRRPKDKYPFVQPVGILGRTTDKSFRYDEEALDRIWDNDEVKSGDLFGMSTAARHFYEHPVSVAARLDDSWQQKRATSKQSEEAGIASEGLSASAV